MELRSFIWFAVTLMMMIAMETSVTKRCCRQSVFDKDRFQLTHLEGTNIDLIEGSSLLGDVVSQSYWHVQFEDPTRCGVVIDQLKRVRVPLIYEGYQDFYLAPVRALMAKPFRLP